MSAVAIFVLFVNKLLLKYAISYICHALSQTVRIVTMFVYF